MSELAASLDWTPNTSYFLENKQMVIKGVIKILINVNLKAETDHWSKIPT